MNGSGQAVNDRPVAGAPMEEAGEPTKEDLLGRLDEVLAYGFGRVEVMIQHHQMQTLTWQKVQTRHSRKRE